MNDEWDSYEQVEDEKIKEPICKACNGVGSIIVGSKLTTHVTQCYECSDEFKELCKLLDKVKKNI
jgi:hypothetical protein